MSDYDTIKKINSQINENTTYKTDLELYGKPEFWEVAHGAGDCEDYALAKYQALIKEGISKDKLRLATCWTETKEYHAVLLADIDGETWVLDNRQPYPTRYTDLYYTWDKLQIAGTNKWESA